MSANNTLPDRLLTRRQRREFLNIGGTLEWELEKDAKLPPPDLSLGPRSPRWRFPSLIKWVETHSAHSADNEKEVA